jgi:two-component system response regulator YesN
LNNYVERTGYLYKLLIVDDEPVIITGIKKLINFDDLSISEVFEAASGKEALEIISKNSIDIILTDINMPDMDGLQLAKKLREYSKNIKIAIITGYDYFEYALSAIKTGVDDYLLKPVSKKDIYELLLKLVNQIKSEDARRKILSAAKISGEKEDIADIKGIEYRDAILISFNENLYNPDFSLKMLAENVSLSPGHLSGLFKNLFGKAFQDYLVSARLERSKILLLSTSLKIYEIAEKTGFDDPNYFSTSFKKYTGISPNEFRKNKRNL